MIRELNFLSPAEILLIEDPKVTVSALARVTFLDLVLKGVLSIHTNQAGKKQNSKDLWVGVGKKFNTYKCLKHEAIFLKVFKKDPSLKHQLSNVLKVAFEDVKNETKYKLKYVYSKERLKPYFKANLIQRLIGIKVISAHGIETQQNIKKELRRIRSNTTKKNKNIVETLLALNSNILLIHKIPTEIFEVIKKERTSLKTTNQSDEYLWMDIDYSDLYQHNTKKDLFNVLDIKDTDIEPIIDTVDGFGESSSDIGSYDSGCSACGGCAGCGGCS